MDHSERVAIIEAECGRTFAWIEAQIVNLDSADHLTAEQKTFWRDRWRKEQNRLVEMGARARRGEG